MPAWYQSKRNKVRERSLAAILAVTLMAFVGLAGIVFAYYFFPNPDLLSTLKEDNSDPGRAIHIEFENTELLIPARLIARLKTRTLRGLQQVDLHFAWPYDEQAKPVRPEDIKDHSNYVLVSLIKRQPGMAEAEKFDKIYTNYFAGPPTAAVSNLRKYTFAPTAPYASIDLFVGQLPDNRVYLTCSKEASSLGPRLCERLIMINDTIAARYRFAVEHLPEWFKIEATVQQIITQIVYFNTPAAGG